MYLTSAVGSLQVHANESSSKPLFCCLPLRIQGTFECKDVAVIVEDGNAPMWASCSLHCLVHHPHILELLRYVQAEDSKLTATASMPTSNIQGPSIPEQQVHSKWACD
jgi:alkyl hydroperoxide reductase subunit AhpF